MNSDDLTAELDQLAAEFGAQHDCPSISWGAVLGGELGARVVPVAAPVDRGNVCERAVRMQPAHRVPNRFDDKGVFGSGNAAVA